MADETGGSDNNFILQFVEEGLDEIIDKIKDFGKVASEELSKAGGSKGGGADFSGTERGLSSGRDAAEKFREALHVLHPILEEAGVGVGNLGAFARVAGAGFVGLAAAIGGSVLVALAKIGEESDRAKRRLDILTDSGRGGGTGAYEGLAQLAKELGVSPSTLGPVQEQLAGSSADIRARENRNVIHPDNYVAGDEAERQSRVTILRGGQAVPAGAPTNAANLTTERAVIEAGQLDRTSADDALKQFGELLKSAQGEKGLPAEALDPDKISPAIALAITKALSTSPARGGVGEGIQTTAQLQDRIRQGLVVSPGQIAHTLNLAEPGIRAQAAAVPPGITVAFTSLEAAAHRVAEVFSGDAGIVGGVQKLTGIINGIADHADRILHPFAPKYNEEDAKKPQPSFSEDPIAALSNYLLRTLRGGDTALGAAAKGPGALQKTPEEAAPGITENLHKLLQGDFSNARLPPNGPAQLPPISPPPDAATPQAVQKLDGTVSSGTGAVVQAVGSAASSIVGAVNGKQLEQTTPQQSTPTAAPPAAASSPGYADGGEVEPDAPQGAFSSLLSSIVAAVQPPNPQPVQEDETQAVGVRGSSGGFLDRGPGTETSDDIDAKLSRGEFVVKAAAVRHVGVDFLHAVNDMKFADGGEVRMAAGGEYRGQHSVEVLPNGDVMVDGVERRPGDPILDDPAIKQAIASAGGNAAKAAQWEAQERKISKHSPFIEHSYFSGDVDATGEEENEFDQMPYARGGHVGFAQRLGSGIAARFSSATASPVMRFASGGYADSVPLVRTSPSLTSPWAGGMERHLIDLRTDHGIASNLRASDATMGQFRRQALMRASVRAGKAQSWDQ